MKKKLLVIALVGLGAVLALPANAAKDKAKKKASISIVGKFYPAFVSSSGGEAGDAKVPTSTVNNSEAGVLDEQKIEAFNSYIRFQGAIDVGNGISAFFQVESDLDFDDEEGTLGGRNSAAGLKGPFGRIFLGQWDTPYKNLHFPTNMFGVSSGSPLSNSNILSRTPYSNRSSRASFHRRQDNMVQYWSPDMGGVQFKIMYGTEEADTAATDPGRISASLVYEKGPVEVGVAYETHKDLRGATTGLGGALSAGVTKSTDDGIAVVGVLKIGKATEVGVEFEILNYESDNGAVGAVKTYERNGARVGVEHKIGKLILGFNFGIAEKGDCKLIGGGACSTSGLGATQISFGGMYRLAKNVGVFAWYTQIDNDKSASYSFLDDSPTGAKPAAFGIGIYGRFKS